LTELGLLTGMSIEEVVSFTKKLVANLEWEHGNDLENQLLNNPNALDNALEKCF